MSKKTNSSNANFNSAILNNGFIRFLAITIIGALITFIIWQSGFTLAIFEKLNLSKGEQVRIVLKHNHSPLVFYLMFGFTFSIIIFLVRELLGIKKKKNKEIDLVNSKNQQIEKQKELES